MLETYPYVGVRCPWAATRAPAARFEISGGEFPASISISRAEKRSVILNACGCTPPD
jgi:hypothetical protein